jgi:uncharacterized protein (UPF0264 family)
MRLLPAVCHRVAAGFDRHRVKPVDPEVLPEVLAEGGAAG